MLLRAQAVRWVLGALLLSAAAGSAAAQGVSPAKVSAGFVEGVGICLKVGLAGRALTDLPEADRRGVSKADEAARFMVEQENPAGPIWNVDTARGVVLLSEPTPGRCDVAAYGPPVARTFETARKAVKRAHPTGTEGPRRAENLVYMEDINVSGPNGPILVRLSGNEPGAPGRMFRFSMLSASVRPVASDAGTN